MTAGDWIARLGLEPHPEGGYFRRIYTDPRGVETPQGARAAASSIHYLLTADRPVGGLHRNRSTILHFLQAGGPVDYWLLGEDSCLRRTRLGYGAVDALYLEVPGGVWKASRLADGADHALVSEVVLPGFDFADHEFLTRAMLRERFSQHVAELLALTADEA